MRHQDSTAAGMKLSTKLSIVSGLLGIAFLLIYFLAVKPCTETDTEEECSRRKSVKYLFLALAVVCLLGPVCNVAAGHLTR